MRVVDSHHHLWEPATRAYSWMANRSLRSVKRFDVRDLREAAPPIAADSELVCRVVGWVDLRAPEVGVRISVVRRSPT